MIKKERLIVAKLRNFIESDHEYSIALIAGIRRVGKTTVLQQLAATPNKDTLYIDFSGDAEKEEERLEAFLNNPTASLLLIDEITYLDGYEQKCQDIFNYCGDGTAWKFKAVITGSSPAHICSLANGKLGGGRSRLFYMPVITFVEYLYFTDKIPSYTDYSAATKEHFADYLQLKGLQRDLAISFDEDYFISYYDETEQGDIRGHSSRSQVRIKRTDLLVVANLLAYQLSEHSTYDTIKNPNNLGEKELRHELSKAQRKALNFTDTLMFKSYKNHKTLSHDDRVRILAFLIKSRVVNIGTELQSTHDREEDAYDFIRFLETTTNKSDLTEFFNKVSVAVCSPLLYTRLGQDILSVAGLTIEQLWRNPKNNDLLGKMLEVYIRGALSEHKNPRLVFTSAKLNYPSIGEVDVCHNDMRMLILCEVTAGQNKSRNRLAVHKYYEDIPCIRICTTQDIRSNDGCIHKIPYAQLCCMIDTGDIYNLTATTAL